MIDFVVFYEVLPILAHFVQNAELLRQIIQQKSSKWAIFVRSGWIWYIFDFLVYLMTCKKRTAQVVIRRIHAVIHPGRYYRSWFG